jgi:tetratricopeptide (TPR) repeat protein
VAAEAKLDLRAAGVAYTQAIKQFADAWANPELATLIERRLGELELTELHAAGLCEEFLLLFPRWLIEFHVERAKQALAGKRKGQARLHSSVLRATSALAKFTHGISLDACQSQIVSSLVNEEHLRESPSVRERALLVLDRVLQADRNNACARNLARTGYAAQLWSLVVGPRQDSKARRKLHHTRGERLLMAKSARRLRRYIKHSGSQTEAESRELSQSYLVLATYLSTYESITLATRMARRARRLDPSSKEVRTLLRTMRKRKHR